MLWEAAGVARYLEEALPRLRALSRQHQTCFLNPARTRKLQLGPPLLSV